MSTKMHFLNSHLDYFPGNCGDYSEDQDERFYQDIRMMEERCQGPWDINMTTEAEADYCWCLKRDIPVPQHKMKTLKRPFVFKSLFVCMRLYFNQLLNFIEKVIFGIKRMAYLIVVLT